MILYNVTVNIDMMVEEEWINWMKATHIPNVMATGLFTDNKFYKLLHESEDGGVNYSVQYFAEDIQKIHDYQENHAPALQEEVREKFEGRFVTFRSVLELVP
ncbi:DUF4286 family protein [Anditalea andensis]|uniref:DUF4286 domain-containing protein n=1 Tax=Anditalea andensis TaxID=1048983 RepID=A0A074L0V1_9BACT|nr:DUF4286 family protein [Anditalea andensis]KEO73483.1 hypothetical protein EL17_11295 [Anditalea andensis]